MAEDSEQSDEAQKTEDPTPRRLEEARKRGQVVYSREINNWMILFTATALVAMAGPYIMNDIKAVLQQLLEQSYAIPTDPAGLGRKLSAVVGRIGADILLPLLLLAAAGALSGFIQTGPLFTFDPIMPDISKISISRGFSRLFSGRAVAELVKGILKLLVVSSAAIYVLRPYFNTVEHFAGLDISQALFEMQTLFLKMMTAALAVLFFLAILDYLYQRHEFMKSMRMSKQDIKEEYRQTEGDPHVKGRLRQLREQRARKRMMQAVPTADVVITNPTHYAVALKYDSINMDAPVMVAKGVDAVAERIKAVANENNIPIVENAALARALFGSMDLDQTIPKDHYKAVAEIISYVFKLKGKKA